MPLRAYTLDAFDTVISFKVYAYENVADEMFEKLSRECKRYEQLFSAYRHDSDVGRINNACGEWVEVDEETYQLIGTSLSYCSCSRGCFDITVKPLVDLWDVHRGIVPTHGEVQEALQHVGYNLVEQSLHDGKPHIRLRDSAASIDLGGIAKGYIADRLSQELSSFDATGFILSLGGNVVTRGVKGDGKAFVVGVRDPNDHEQVVGTMALVDCSAVASGVTERYFEKDGVCYSHIINPKTGNPIETDVKSVTVVAPRSVDAEGFSTTLCALGMKDGPEFAFTCDELYGAVFVSTMGDVVIVETPNTQGLSFNKTPGQL